MCLWRMMFNSTDDYLSKLAEKNVLAEEKDAVLAALEKSGKWEQFIEWRISTYIETTISYEMFKDEKRFRVHVKCDHEFSCLSPTVERALEMAGLYQQLIFKLFRQVGWASWESIDVLKSE